ncbi:hypothetical protein V5N11_014399 [Cardamine amara subsp. amara]|uniref:Uncharacterized protein n=1 Tax=Cardamine amara subsp. amara TaxID=228776 RepID=A0ABD1C4Q0_CARAN
MSSGKGASQSHTSAENTPIQMFYDLLKQRNFMGVHCLVDKWHDQFEQARAISDVLLAVDNPLPSGLMDYYGMIRVTKGGPVLREDFMKLMKLLDGRDNSFPLRQEAADKALLAWSLLSKPHIKAQYDLSISTSHNNGTPGNGCGYINVGGSQSDGVLFGGPDCSKFHESKYNHFQSKDTSFILKKHNVGPGTDDEVVIISDDDDDDDDDSQETIKIAPLPKIDNIE